MEPIPKNDNMFIGVNLSESSVLNLMMQTGTKKRDTYVIKTDVGILWV
jgi:hypothetical protein